MYIIFISKDCIIQEIIKSSIFKYRLSKYSFLCHKHQISYYVTHRMSYQRNPIETIQFKCFKRIFKHKANSLNPSKTIIVIPISDNNAMS